MSRQGFLSVPILLTALTAIVACSGTEKSEPPQDDAVESGVEITDELGRPARLAPPPEPSEPRSPTADPDAAEQSAAPVEISRPATEGASPMRTPAAAQDRAAD